MERQKLESMTYEQLRDILISLDLPMVEYRFVGHAVRTSFESSIIYEFMSFLSSFLLQLFSPFPFSFLFFLFGRADQIRLLISIFSSAHDGLDFRWES